ncbi:MAG: hypothetical protein H6732_02315 [Alphaproteobacteria bacterium]|nr:hypothetical protein [Alphaproteobacteria bacterium]
MVLALLLTGLAGCTGATPPPPAAPDPLLTPEAWQPADLVAGTRCAGAPTPEPVDVLVRVQLLVGPTVDEPGVLRELQTAIRFWGERGVRLVPAGPARHVATHALLSGPLDADRDEEARLDRALAPVRDFVDTHARPPRGRIVVAVLPTILTNGSWAADVFQDMVGLAFASPETSATPADEAARALARHLDLERPHDPVVLLSRDDLVRQPPWAPPLALAHELGHALGLEHEADRDNLMRARQGRCLPDLTDAQLAQVAAAARALAR